MSRLGKMPIKIKDGVTVEVKDSTVTVKGSKGELSLNLRPEVEVVIEEGQVVSKVKRDTKNADAFWGTTRSLIASMIKGVSEGFEKKLQLVGVGYRAKSHGPRKIVIDIGYSHPVEFEAPEGISLEVPDNTTIIVKGIDKQLVGLTASKIRSIRKPEPYKGKGIKYSDEILRRKAGKAAKTAA